MAEDKKQATEVEFHSWDKLSAQLDHFKTTMLEAFQSYSNGMLVETQKPGGSDPLIEARLFALERRVRNLEARGRSL